MASGNFEINMFLIWIIREENQIFVSNRRKPNLQNQGSQIAFDSKDVFYFL